MQLQQVHCNVLADERPPIVHDRVDQVVHRLFGAAGITLNIALYKAMWEYSPAQLRKLPPNWRHSRAAHSARIGLQIMADAGLAVQHIDDEGWACLLSLVHAAKNRANPAGGSRTRGRCGVQVP